MSADSPLRSRLPDRVRLVEVGPRDGLQAEERILGTEDKLEFVERLLAAGHRVIEAASFASPQAVPQLADAEELARRLPRRPGLRYVALALNERGLDRALASGFDDLALFVPTSESYALKNVGRERAEVVASMRGLVRKAKGAGMRVRGYLSMAIADPWDGPTPVPRVRDTARQLLEDGADEVAVADTLGSGTPGQIQQLVGALIASGIGPERMAVHFHDTYGQALANVLAALELGITTIDSSAGGLGGSPFAKAAAGNLATEDLIWMLDGLGIESGVDVRSVAMAGAWVCERLGREPAGRVTRALRG